MNHIASEERSHLKGWQLLLPLPSVEPSIKSCQSLGVGDEQAAEENVHLDPQKERPFLKLREGLLKHKQDGDDDDDAEGEDEVEAGEGDEVGDGGRGPPAQDGGHEGPGGDFGGDHDQGRGGAEQQIGDLGGQRWLARAREYRHQAGVMAWREEGNALVEDFFDKRELKISDWKNYLRSIGRSCPWPQGRSKRKSCKKTIDVDIYYISYCPRFHSFLKY